MIKQLTAFRTLYSIRGEVGVGVFLMILIYSSLSIIIISLLINKANNKLFLGVILVWLYFYTVFDRPEYKINLSFIGIDLQPNRLLFLVLAPVFFFYLIKKVYIERFPTKSSRLYSFEYLLILYIAVCILISLVNIRSIGFRETVAAVTFFLCSLLVYWASNRYFSPNDVDRLVIASIILGVITSLVGLYQFFVDSSFFRYGATRNAFSIFIRANGIFSSEYDQSFFIIIAFVLAYFYIKNIIARYAILTIFTLAVFVSMHRLSWIILLANIVFVFFFRFNIQKLLLWITAIIIVAIIIINVPISEITGSEFINDMFYERITSDTLTGRFLYYDFSINLIKQYPFGIGSYYTDLYSQHAYSSRLPTLRNQPLVVHNGYLGAAVKYGIPAFILYVCFLATSLLHFFKVSKSTKNKMSYFHLLLIITFCLYNITQDFSFLGSQMGVLLMLLLGTWRHYALPRVLFHHTPFLSL